MTLLLPKCTISFRLHDMLQVTYYNYHSSPIIALIANHKCHVS